jgi:hypothetical protein
MVRDARIRPPESRRRVVERRAVRDRAVRQVHDLLPIVLAGLTVSCGSVLPEPETSRHPPDSFIEVPYPPPPSRVEWVPEQPKSGSVWIDGEWAWIGSRWAWVYGRWVFPLEAPASWARWELVRRGDGSLLFAPGVWHSASGKELTPPASLAVGRASEDSVVGADGEIQPTAPNILREAPR